VPSKAECPDTGSLQSAGQIGKYLDVHEHHCANEGTIRQYRHSWSQPRLRGLIRTGALTAAGLLVAALGSAGSAAAAASAGYTASYVPAGPENSQSVAVNPVTDTVYVGEASTTGYELVAIDGSSRAIEATLPLAVNPLGIAVNPATNTVYVAGGGHVLVIDGATNSLSGTISLPAGTAAAAVAVDSATNMIYVASPIFSGAVVVIDGSSNTVTATVSSGGRPEDIGVDEATDVIWVANVGGPVVAISGATGSITHSVSVNTPLYLAVNQVTDRVYVASSSNANPLTVIDGATGTITTTVPMTNTGTGRIAVDPSADVVFARGFATFGGSTHGGMVAIDGATSTVADVLSASGMGAAVDPATGTVYETSSDNGFPGIWAITPSGSNAISPLLSGPATAAGSYGAFLGVSFSASGLPVPAVTENGPLPAGVTLSAAGVLSGRPSAGSAGVYPITVTASNGVAPDYSIPFTLTITPAASPPAVAVGVEGTDGAMYVQAPQRGTGWHSLGGQIVGPPAVAAPPNPDGTSPVSPLFIATRTDSRLYIRSLAAGWQQLGPARGTCLGAPAAVITDGTLTVACRGTDSALWENSAPVPPSGLPQFTGGWTKLGGVLTAGPAVAPVGGVLTFFARGTNGHIYTRTLTARYTEQPWSCLGAPAAALQAAADASIFACEGTNRALSWSSNSGAGWGPTTLLGGTLAAGPAIAATSQVPVFLGEGTTRAVYERTPATGWTSLGGTVLGGIGAAALN
jgi:YVTN family beta-propeller protein